MKRFWKYWLKRTKVGKSWSFARAIERRGPTIERTSARAPKLGNECTCAHARKKEDRLHCD
jgi:hypothetical protein